MAQLKDLLVEGKSRFIDKIYASDQFISKVVQGTSPFLIDSSTLVSNLNADLLDGFHATNFLAWSSMQSIGSGAPFQDAVNFFNNLSNLNNGGKLVYNHSGAEYTELFTRRSDSVAHGTILKWGYTDKYIRIIRMVSGAAQSSDWEKISAGYADTAGYANDSDKVDGYHADSFLQRLRRLNESFGHSSIASGMFPPALFELKSAGYPVYDDPEFASGTNSVNVYNNSGGGTVTITREQAGDHANSSGYQLKIVTNGTASPGAGGFYQSITSRANAIFVQIFRAKVPVGYSVTTASNSMGANYQDKFITNREGTGKWEWYARVVYCGASGSFANGGHVYLSASSGYSNTSVTWYVSHCSLIDITKGNYSGLRTKYSDVATSASSATNADTVDGEHAAAFAHRQTWNNMVHSGNEYTWIAPGYTGGIWINYRTSSGAADGSINEYIFGTGKGTQLAKISLNTFHGNITGNAVTATTATTATRLGQNTEMTYGWSGINYFNISAANQSAAKVNDTPHSSATWTHILRFNHANNSGYYTDLAVPFNANGMYYKRIQNGTLQNANTNGGWVELLDVLNYSNYAQTYTAQEGAVNHFGQHVTVESTVTKDPANNGYYATGTLRRISQMNFNGYTVWTVSGYFKAASAITVNINLCDKTSNSVYGENSSSVSLTTSYVYHKFTYDNVNQYNTSSAYNGFLDIEGSSDVVVYVKDLMIEHGYVAHEWRPSLSDSTTKVKTITNSTNSAHYLTFVDSNNSSATEETLYTSSKVTVNPNTGNIGINVTNPSSPIDASGGYLKVTYNGNTLSIGSGNTSFTHFSNSTSREFYFSNAMTVNGNLRPYITKSFSSGTTSSRWTKVYVTDGLDSSGALNLTSAASTAINFIQGTATNMSLNTAGVLTLKANAYTDSSAAGSLNLQNSNIYGVNSLIFADACENGAEGIQFYRDATHADTIWDNSGILYYAPNRPYGSAGTSYKIWHEGNDGSGSGLDADLLDGEHLSKFWKHGNAYPYGKTDKPWHLIGEYSQSNSGQINVSITFFVAEFYSEISYGILTVRARSEASATTMEFYTADWSLANNINANNFVITWKCVNNVFTLKIYCKRTGWSSYAFRKIEEQSWGNPIDVWILHTAQNQNEYCLAGIPSDETQVVSSILSINNSAPPTTHNHDGRYLQYNGWWTSGNGNNADNANGMVFAYENHNVPHQWGILTTFDYQYNSAYKMQLFSDGYNNGYTYYRNRSSDRGGWNPWVRFLDSTNYTEYTVTKTGGGASGTWGINISGSAPYLTLTYCTSDTNDGVWNTIKNGKTNPTTNKVNFYTIYNNGGPTTYGEMLEILSYKSNHWQPQLWFGAGKSGHMYYRNKNYNDDTWGNWLTIIDSGNYSSYLGYIGTTAVQASSATQNLTGIGSVTASGDNIITKSSTSDTYFRVVNNNGTISLLTSSNRGLYNSTGTAGWVIATNGTNSWLGIGNIGIGTTSPSQKLHVAGTIYSSVAQGTAPLKVDSSTLVANLHSEFTDYASVLRDPTYHTLGSRRNSANITFADGGLHYYLATSSMSAANGKPDSDGHILHMAWDNSKWDAQLTLPTSATGVMQWRVQTNGTDASWSPWKTVIDSSNIGSQSVAYATVASKISDITTSDAASSTATWRRVWFSYNDNVTGRPAYSDNFTYQTSTGTLKVGKLSITGAAGNSWLGGQQDGPINLNNATNTGSYWPWIRQTNTGSSKYFSIGVLNTSFYIIGSASSRTDNGYDYGWSFNVANGWAYGNFQNADTVDGLHASDFARKIVAGTAIAMANASGTITVETNKIIPVTTTGTTAVTFNFTWNSPAACDEAHVIITGSGSSKTITIGNVNSDSTNTKKNNTAIKVTSGGYGEISILYFDSKYFIRAVGN